MNRGYFVVHLTNNECWHDEEWDDPIAGEMWRNAINGHICYIPYDDELSVGTWCHIVYELGIDPPLEFDAHYHVYSGWRNGPYREDQQNAQQEATHREPDNPTEGNGQH